MALNEAPIPDAATTAIENVPDAPEPEGQTVPRTYIDAYESHVGEAPPAAPYILTPPNNSQVEYTFEVTGTALRGTRISVYADDHVKGFALTGESGTWSSSVTLEAAGTSYITAFAEGPGGLSTKSNIVTVTAVAPLAAPYIEEPMNNAQLTANTDAIFAGAAPPDVTVYLYHQGEDAPVGSDVSDGTWEITKLLPTLAVGTVSELHNYWARYVCTAGPNAGRWSLLSNIVTINVNPQPKTDTPTVTQPTSPANGVYITISGTAELDAHIRLYVTGAVTFTHEFHSDPTTGAWSISSAGFTAEGTYSITATAQMPLHSVSDRAVARTLVIDRTAPAAPVFTNIPAGFYYSPFTITGTAEPNATVYLDAGSIGLFACAVDGAGAWAKTGLGANLTSVTFTAVCTDAAGNNSPPVSFNKYVYPAPYVTYLPVTGTVAPSPIQMTGTCLAGATVKAIRDGVDYAATVTGATFSLSLPVPTDALPYTFSIGQNTGWGYGTWTGFTYRVPVSASPTMAVYAAYNTVDVTISGTCVDGATVTLKMDGTQVYSAAISGTSWSTTITGVTEASHALALTQQEVGKAVSSTVTATFVNDRTAPTVPAITAPALNAIFVQNQPVPISVTCAADADYTIIEVTQTGSATPTASFVLASSGTVEATGLSTIASYSIRARSVDAAQNHSAWTSSVNVFYITVAPTTPTPSITRAPAFTNENPLVIEVTSVQNATVTLSGGPYTMSGPTVLSGGAWKYTASFAGCPDGTYYFTATALLPLHAVSASTVTSIVIVDRAGSGSSINSQGLSNAPKTPNPITVTGTTIEPLCTVRLYAGAVLIATVASDITGAWSATWSPVDGTYILTAVATDRAGNVGATSVPVAYWFDRVAPTAPTIDALPAATMASPITVSGTAPIDAATLYLLRDGAFYNSPMLTPNANNTAKLWSTSMALPVGPATVAITARVDDNAGNYSGYASTSILVDRTGGKVPVLTFSPTGAIINSTADKTKTFSFTGVLAGTVVELQIIPSNPGYVKTAANVTANASGAGSFAPISFADVTSPTTFTVNARGTDIYGAVSSYSNTVTVTVNMETALTTPTINQIGPQGTNTSTITGTHNWSGTGTAPTIDVYDNGEVKVPNLTTTATAALGVRTWTTGPLPFINGSHVITAIAVSQYGNNSPTSLPMSFGTNSTVPAGTSLSWQGSNPGQYHNTLPWVVGVTTSWGYNVLVKVNGTTIGTVASSASNGSWQYQVTTTDGTTAMPDGTYNLTACTVSPTGVESGPSAPLVCTIDRVQPNPPVFTPGGPYGTPTITISGTSEAGATVNLFNTIATYPYAYTSLGSTVANGSGNWSKTVTPSRVGAIDYYANQVDLAGNTSANSGTMAFSTFVPVPGPVTIDTIPATVNPVNYRISGTCPADAYAVTVYFSPSIGVAPAAGVVTGTTWAQTYTLAYSTTYTVQAAARWASGVEGVKCTAQTFTTTAMPIPETPVVDLAPPSVVTSLPMIFEGPYVGEVSCFNAWSDEDGDYLDWVANSVWTGVTNKWRISISPVNGNYNYVFQMRYPNALGQTGGFTSAYPISVNLAAPAAAVPTVTSPWTTPSVAATITTNPFTVTGTTDAGAVVSYREAQAVVRPTTATANASGVWSMSLVPTANTGAQWYEFRAYKNGVYSAWTPVYTANYSISGGGGGGGGSLTVPTLSVSPNFIYTDQSAGASGTGTPGDRIYFSILQSNYGEQSYMESPTYATVGANGTYSVDWLPIDTSAEGSISVYARAGDANGVRSAPSNVELIEISMW